MRETKEGVYIGGNLVWYSEYIVHLREMSVVEVRETKEGSLCTSGEMIVVQRGDILIEGSIQPREMRVVQVKACVMTL